LKIRISNFRSIRDTTFTFPESGLAAVIGANGSGKSNLIKLLQFLGSIATDGVEGAVRVLGGFESVFPKALTPPELRHAVFEVDYQAIVSPLAGESDSTDNWCRHSLSLGHPSANEPILRAESLEFQSIPEDSSAPRLNVSLKIDGGRHATVTTA